MMRKLFARLAIGVVGATGLVVGVQAASMADGMHCTQYPSGEACLHENLGGLPGGSVIQAEFVNNKGSVNTVSVALWATDMSWFVGANPTVGSTRVPLGDNLIYGSNFLPLGHGTCHTYQAKINLANGNVLTSPKEQYCYNDHS